MYQTAYHSEDISSKHFLVTGGAGFIGSNLVEYLLKYKAGKIRILDNLSNGFYKNIAPFLSHDSVEFLEGDIRELDTCQKACDGIDIVLHQAALGSVPRSINDPITSNEVNVGGFLNMLVAVRDQKVSRMVYAASSSTYGDSPTLPKDEPVIGRPLSPYAVTKYVNELYADVFEKTYGIDCVGLRYFNVYGPRQDPKGAYAAVIPLFIDAALSGKSPQINGDGKQTRDFTFVENAVQANIKAALAPKLPGADKVYNVACGERISLLDLLELLEKFEGARIEREHRDARAGDVRDSLANIGKARQDFGYEPLFTIDKGLKITLEWFKENAEFIAKRN